MGKCLIFLGLGCQGLGGGDSVASLVLHCTLLCKKLMGRGSFSELEERLRSCLEEDLEDVMKAR